MREPQQRPNQGSTLVPEVTFVKHYVLLRHCLLLASADAQHAHLADAEIANSESEDELPALADPAPVNQAVGANIGEEEAHNNPGAVNSLWESMGHRKSQSKDPAPSSLFPRLNGAD